MQKTFRIGFVLVAVSVITSLLFSCSSTTPAQTPALMPITADSLELVYQDEFRENAWVVSSDDDATYEYRNGEYVITGRKTDWRFWARAPFDVFENGVIEVDARTISNFNTTKYAILFREKEKNYYCLTFDGDFYSIERHYQDKFSNLLPPTKSAYITKDGIANRLKIACLGNTIEVYVNNQRLATITDDTFAAGKVALAVIGKDSSVAFDNLKIYRFTQAYVQKAAPSPTESGVIVISPGIKPTSGTPTTPKAENLTDFLDRAADIKAVRYVVVGTFPEKPASIGAVWFKGSQIRMETEINGVPVIIIQDSATSTQVNCLPLKKLTAQGEYDALNLTPVDLVHDLRESVAAITGSEKLDGKDCAVIEFTTKDGNKAKSWVWKEKGLLLKTVTEVPEGKEVIELKSLSFDNIPDSLFQTPANFQMVSEEELNIAASYTPSMYLTKRYINSTYSYSLLYPETWTLAESGSEIVIISNGYANLLISILKAQEISLDALVQVNKTSSSARQKDYKEISSGEISLSDGTPAVLVISSYTDEKTTVPMKEMKVLAVKNNNAFFLTASSNNEGWTKFGSTLGTIMDTFIFSAVSEEFDIMVDLGNLVEEAKYNIVGWGNAEDTLITKLGDQTSRYLGQEILGEHNSLDIVIKNADTDYVLTMEIGDVLGRGEFDVYVNNWGPVFMYRSPSPPPIIAVRQFRIPKSYITGDKITITFRRSGIMPLDIFNIKLTPLS